MARRSMILTAAIVAVFLSFSMVMAEEPGSYKLDGEAYFYYMHDASEGDGQTNKFAFSRVYLGVKYFLSDDFMVRYLTDVGPGEWRPNVFAKYAYLDWKMRDNLNLVIGLAETNNWNMPEKAWGYRVIRYSPMESFGDYWWDWKDSYGNALGDWAQSLQNTDPVKAAEVDIHRYNLREGGETRMGSSADLGVGVKFKPFPLY